MLLTTSRLLRTVCKLVSSDPAHKGVLNVLLVRNMLVVQVASAQVPRVPRHARCAVRRAVAGGPAGATSAPGGTPFNCCCWVPPSMVCLLILEGLHVLQALPLRYTKLQPRLHSLPLTLHPSHICRRKRRRSGGACLTRATVTAPGWPASGAGRPSSWRGWRHSWTSRADRDWWFDCKQQ